MANKSFYLDNTVEIDFRGQRKRINKKDVELFNKIKARDEAAKKPKNKVEVAEKLAEQPKEQKEDNK